MLACAMSSQEVVNGASEALENSYSKRMPLHWLEEASTRLMPMDSLYDHDPADEAHALAAENLARLGGSIGFIDEENAFPRSRGKTK